MSDELEEFVNEATASEETPAEDSATEETPEPQADAETGDKDAEPEQQESEDVPPTPAEPEKQSDSVPRSALLDERKKRQERERDLREAQAQLQQQQQQQQPRPDLLDDQEGYAAHIQQQVDSKIRDAVTAMSVNIMRSQHDDYDPAEDKFMQMVSDDPTLKIKLQQSEHPAEFVYETVKKAELYAEMQDVDSYKAKLKAEAKAEVKAEIKAEAKAKADKAAELNGAISPSLTNTRAAGANNEALTVPDPLAEGGFFDR